MGVPTSNFWALFNTSATGFLIPTKTPAECPQNSYQNQKTRKAGRNGRNRDGGENKSHMQNDQENPSQWHRQEQRNADRTMLHGGDGDAGMLDGHVLRPRLCSLAHWN